MKNNQKSLPFLAQPALHAALAWLGILLLGWPIIQIAGRWGMDAFFVYAFGLWVALVVLLFVIARSLSKILPTHVSPDEAAEKQGSPAPRSTGGAAQ